jgi:hypothetical protein
LTPLFRKPPGHQQTQAGAEGRARRDDEHELGQSE